MLVERSPIETDSTVGVPVAWPALPRSLTDPLRTPLSELARCDSGRRASREPRLSRAESHKLGSMKPGEVEFEDLRLAAKAADRGKTGKEQWPAFEKRLRE